MAQDFVPDLHPAGLDLFLGSESFLTDLSEEDESMIAGGKRSNTNSRRRPKRRRPKRRRPRRRVGRRSVSRT